jgi:hypothetical protein
MDKAALSEAVNRYLDRFAVILKRASGPVNNALYADNHDGVFSFKNGPLVIPANVVNNATDLGYSKTTLQSNQYVFNTWQKTSRGNWRNDSPTQAEVGFSDNAIPSDIAGFSYDTANDVIKNSVDTKSMVGFVSPEGYDDYVLDVTLKSTSTWQNDPLGLLLGYVRDPDGTTHTLTVFRSVWDNYSGLDSAMQVAVDYNTIGGTVIAEQNEGLLWVDGTPATGPAPTTESLGGTAPHAFKPWAQAPNGIQLRVTRTGDTFTIETSNYDVPGLVPEATLTFSLNDHPALARFKGPSPYGYVAISQDNAIWEANQRPGNAQTVYDLRDGTQHIWDGNNWSIVSGSIDDLMLPGRMCFSPTTGKVFYRDHNGNVHQLLRN